jgi:hypothetical protein
VHVRRFILYFDFYLEPESGNIKPLTGTSWWLTQGQREGLDYNLSFGTPEVALMKHQL